MATALKLNWNVSVIQAVKLNVEQYKTGKRSQTPVSVFHWEVKTH